MLLRLAKSLLIQTRRSGRALRTAVVLLVLTTVSLCHPSLITAIRAQEAPNGPSAPSMIPNDDSFALQTYLERVKAPRAWALAQHRIQKRDVVIAVLDTGVDIDHLDLKNQVWVNADEIPGDGIDNDNNSYIDDVNGWDFLLSIPDPRPKMTDTFVYEAVQHGTVVAGILSGQLNNFLGIAGASYNAKIMPLRVLDNQGSGNTLVLAQAVDYAVENGADVINLSLVGEVRDPQLEASLDAAYRAGVAVVASSGNQEKQGVNLNVSPRYPVCDSDTIVNKVIGVAAVDSANRLAPFSNYGSHCIDIAAPGTDLYSTVWFRQNDAQFAKHYSGGWTGTSVAAPLVSATLALIRQIAPNLSVAELYRILISSASSLSSTNTNFSDMGAGLLNMEKAVQTALALSRTRPIRVALAAGRGFEPKVTVKDKDGITVSEFMAYAPNFKGGVQLAVGDLDNDGADEIVTAPLSGGGPHVRIFDQYGALKGQFMAYDGVMRGGFSLAIANVHGDSNAEIIIAPLARNQPLVHVYSHQGALLSEFYAYAETFQGGVHVAAGDTDRDHRAEIVTAPASGGGPHIRIFNSRGTVLGQFMAFNDSMRSGYSIAVGDLDHDGEDDIAVVPVTDRGAHVRVFSGSGRERNRFLLYPELDAVEHASNVFISDITGDGYAELLSYPLAPGMNMRVLDYFGRVIQTLDLSRGRISARAERYTMVLLRG